MKHFGLFAAAMWLFSFLTAGWLYKVSYLLSMLGFVLFFGPQDVYKRQVYKALLTIQQREPE